MGERKVFLRRVQEEHQASAEVGPVAAVVVTVSLALLAVVLYVSILSMIDNPVRRTWELEELIFATNVHKMINKYGWNK